MDTFMDYTKSYEILREKYIEHGKIIVAYGFDDTVRLFRSSDCSMVIDIIKK